MNQQMLSHAHAYLAGRQYQHAVSMFQSSLLSARLKRLVNKALGKESGLREPVSRNDGVSISPYVKGVQNVKIENIDGSLSRSQDFDRSFRPLSNHSKGRWMRIDDAWHQEIALPPVKLYYRDGLYYVVDGHHRISVAKAHGQEYIEAEVAPLP
jgi:hypothetical protein